MYVQYFIAVVIIKVISTVISFTYSKWFARVFCVSHE